MRGLADPSYLDIVLKRKLGLPISLSVLYAVVCRELRVPVELVGMVRCSGRGAGACCAVFPAPVCLCCHTGAILVPYRR